MVRVLLADSDSLFAEGLAALLTRDNAVQVVGRARDAAEAERKCGILRPDVVLMDMNLSLGGGVGALRHILTERPDQAVCMLTESQRESDLFAAVRAGARGYLLKTVALPELTRAIHTLAHGGSVIAPRMAARLLAEFGRLSDAMMTDTGAMDRLTDRERQVLGLMALGAQNKEIARALSISQHTVKVHVHNVFDKLALRNRRQAAAYAVQTGLVQEVRGRALR